MNEIYVGCGLTHAPEEFRNSVTEFKNSLRECGIVVSEFLGLKGGSAEDVYKWDINKCVRSCIGMIAICDYPSTGLGVEVAVAALDRRIPVLFLASEESRVTRLLLGLEEAESNVSFIRYAHDLSHAVEPTLSWIKNYFD